MPICTCADHYQMSGLQQLCSRCLHRNAPETVVVTLHRQELVDIEAAVTCKLQARPGSHGFAGNLFGPCPQGETGVLQGVWCLLMYA